MIDSTKVVLPAVQAFTSGQLLMPEDFAAGYADTALTWSDYPLNAVMTALFTLLVLVTLKNFLNIAHDLFDSLSRWKASLNIEASVQKMEDRNLLGYIYIIPVAMIADRYSFIPAKLATQVPVNWHCLVPLGAIVVWLLLKHLVYRIIAIKVRRVETFRIAHKSFYNYWILAALLMIVTAGIMSLAHTPEPLGRQILMYELGGMYLLGILRESQILSSAYSPIAVFLYLCALELIPSGALVAAAILL